MISDYIAAITNNDIQCLHSYVNTRVLIELHVELFPDFYLINNYVYVLCIEIVTVFGCMQYIIFHTIIYVTICTFWFE